MNVQKKRADLIIRMLKQPASAPVPEQVTDKEQVSAPMPVTAKDQLPEPVAIIGLSGYFPQCNNVEEFWNALDENRSLISAIPDSRIDWETAYDPQGKDVSKSRTKWGGVIPDIKQFDPHFFGVLGGEANLMDPRKRLLLMSVYHAMENAGYAPSSFRNTMTGVFVAVEEDEYAQCMREAGIDVKSTNVHSASLIANELSYFFDLRGSSEVINTMCSGAAVAIHRAVKALRSGEINCALVSAANLLLTPDPFVFLSQTGQMSDTDTVHSFGKDANGFLRSDGVASIVLKPLSQAVRDNDSIYAVIRNTAVNYNGKSGASIATPNISAHEAVIKACYEGVALDPSKLTYIEAQGMGNPAADIAEWEACNQALKSIAAKKAIHLREGACRISTIKPLAGHMHAASALGALLKIIRSFQTNTIQGIKGLKEINPDLDIVNQPCRLLTAAEAWLPGDEPRLAGLHSYGAGGNNVHLLIEEYKAPERETASYNELTSSKFIVPVSAETEAQCKQIVQNLLSVLLQHPEYRLADLAYTLQCGRDSMKHRVVFAVTSQQELIDRATAFLQGDKTAPVVYDPALAGKLTAWLKGESVVWNSSAENVQRLHLPGYPFNCQSYWFRQPGKIAAAVAADKKETGPGAEHIIREVLSDFLLKPAAGIELNKQFSDLGFDSLLVTKIAFALNRRYGLEVEPAVFFEHTTPAQLIAFIGQEFARQFDKSGAVTASGNKSRQEEKSVAGNVPVAIVGVAGNFPKAAGIDALWQNLVAGKHCIEEVPADRWPVNEYYEQDAAAANRAGKSYGKWGGFLENFYYFDPLFFNISPLETEIMSPKERIFLQCAWHAMEDAGYTPASLSAEQVGVFVGVTRSGIDPYKISPSTVSNRVSYVLNLNGPSLTIDTACSSSLIAIHEACRHIQSGECTMALAGGVHVFLDPSHFSLLSSMYMLSPDGVTRSFGDNANGMVPGEGSGVLLLKSLDRAMADGDIIYGVIKGSAINHGGKTNGFTVPNPKAHQRLIRTALKKAGVNAREVSYVEAHGTGTSLGDPVEVRGLAEAFKADTADTQYCRLGSLKSNIGHLEAAAGVAGLIKVLLQMKHNKLAPSLHAKVPNPQINFAKTPFVVQQELAAWEPVNAKGEPIPKIACVSSFGAGGANAHVVLEAFDQERHRSLWPRVPADKYAIVLSAKDQDRLQEQVKQLLAFLQTNGTIHIADLAFTLQTGRVHFEKRLALEVTTLRELEIKLNDYINGNGAIDKLYIGGVTATPEAIAEGIVDTWLGEHNYSALLNTWVKGADIDWRKLYGSAANGYTFPHRISLPGYPFLKEYYGLPEIFNRQQVATAAGNVVGHPLVHTNHSTFFETRFGARFTGEEFFLKDHVVKGDRVLPGVAYLEMARSAIQQAAQYTGSTIVRLQNVGWIQPVIVHAQPVNIDIDLTVAEDGAVNFEIVSPAPGDSNDRRIHNQGMALLIDRVEAPVIDLNAIRQSAEFVVYPKESCYDIYEKTGVAYGIAHKAIEQIAVSHNQILAELSLPDVVSGTLTQFQLHPSLLDAALQSIIGFRMRNAGAANGIPLAIPFAIEELTLYAPCEAKMWAHIRSGNDSDIDNMSFDIDLLNATGRVCVQIKKYTARIYNGQQAPQSLQDILLMRPHWQEAALPFKSAGLYERRIIVHAEENRLNADRLNEQPGVSTVALRSAANSIDTRFTEYAQQLLQIVRGLLQEKPAGNVLIQVVAPADGEAKLTGALHALLNTAHAENPLINGQLIGTGTGYTTEQVLELLNENTAVHGSIRLQYNNGERRQWQLIEAAAVKKDQAHPWKKEGVYLVTGGAGGIGQLFAKEITQKAPGAVVILTGRGAIGDRQAIIDSLINEGGKVVYRPVDVADATGINELARYIKNEFGQLTGIIHCAGVLHDGFILNKTMDTFNAVLAPKVQGLVNLDKATRSLHPELFIICSSLSALIGNPGQCDYAAANAFMDEYARYRNASEQSAGTFMLSINWPLWAAGGMRVDEYIQEQMFEQIGMMPLQTELAFQALYQAIAARVDQMAILQGDTKRLKAALLQPFDAVAGIGSFDEKDHEPTVTGNGDNIKVKAVAYFKKLLATTIKLPADRIDAAASMDKYGIDSIMVMQLTRELEKVFGSLPKTLFFEYRNINDLTNYFIQAYEAKLQAILGITQEPERATLVVKVKETKAPVWKDRIKNKIPYHQPKPQKADSDSKSPDIAIIGISGRYPQANNLQEFWENLRAGKNCITEVPPDRWDHSVYFDSAKNQRGKTYTKWGGFMNGVDKFDPLFFNISPREAESLDPQERLFLQCAYEAVEDAGYTKDNLGKQPGATAAAQVGVYVGVMWEEYHLYAAQETALGNPMVLSSSPSSIANRVSYYFNFSGPSMAVDTMCSSSITSIHLACQSLLQGECAVALAGGVNVSIHPNKYLVLGYGRYASSKGLCESFGAGGDGYVPGEGVGVVVLKPLAAAIADKDHIYGVIKGTAINHGGRTNGFTVPDPGAQANVISKAITMAGIDVTTISYLEAHGTGTSLGDPIEIAGLHKAFNTGKKQYCAIGSVKSNIGHCESAAGVAGISKILLQMKHRQLVPSLHSATLNPNIRFEDTPFVVQQELADWKRPQLEQAGRIVEVPRRAGISSFGAGGSNAHLVIEEYIPAENEPSGSVTGPFAILLSAKTEDRLKEKARQLLSALNAGAYTDAQLPAMAYTLQTGREAMEFRLAIEVNTISALKEKLIAFDQEETVTADLYTGKVKLYKELLSFFALDEDMTGTVGHWIRKKKYGKLLALWVNGFEMDWEKLYSGAILSKERPQRIALPTYPFLQNRYWPAIGSPVPAPAFTRGAESEIHPLVHSNTSTFAEQKFTSVFTGHEFFLKDHVVNGEKLLPAVAYLEMVNEAMVRASGSNGENIHLENIVFASPLIVNGHPEKVNIGLFPRDNQVQFEIAGQQNASEKGSKIHSQGMARYVKAGDAPVADLDRLQQLTSRYTLEKEEFYRLFSGMGITYGEGQRAVSRIHVGEQQLLAKIFLPQSVTATFDKYILHPSIMDAALQAVIGFWAAGQKENIPLAVPYAIGAVEIFGRCSKEMWAHITRSGEQQREALSFDIDVCDRSGKICVRMKGVTSRLVNGPQPSSHKEGLLFMQPYWKPAVVQSPDEPIRYAQRMVVVINNQSLAAGISTQLAGISVIPVKAESASMSADFENGALQIFREVKQLLQSKPANTLLLQVLVPFNESRSAWNAMGALFKTARMENPLFAGQVISVDWDETTESVLYKLQENSQAPQDTVIQYKEKIRCVERLRKFTPAEGAGAPVWKDKGIYLITGGAGGLGLIFAKAIAAQVKEPTLILTGRSILNEDREKEVAAIRSLGARVVYRQADISSEQATAALIQIIIREYSGLNGIIHSAGITRDSFILKKSEEAIREVMAPKVNGIINLDIQTSDLPLDFFIVCSSSAGYTGNAAQADYAMANAFMDQYARYRHSLVKANKRSGKTVSINWPLWKEGGIHVPAQQEQWLLDAIGMKAMGTAEGLQALYRIMQQEEPQMMVMQGIMAKMKASFLENISDKDVSVNRPEKSDPPFEQIKSDASDVSGDITAAIRLLKELLSGTIKLPVEAINEEKPMEEYGIDSVMVMQMTNKLEEEFGSLSKTLFFEYQTIDALAAYFLKRFPEKFTTTQKATNIQPDKNIQHVDDAISAAAFRNTRFTYKPQPAAEAKTVTGALDIAVVGLAGRYPGARDLKAFWQVLKEGKNCITEIPANRWNAGNASAGGKWGGFLDGIDEFDPLFFGISAAEAALLDPQERLFLQCAYEAIEDAGYTRSTLGLKKNGKGSGNVGVYAGVMWDEYQLYAAQETALGKPMALSGIPGSIANRVSYFCNFNGISIALNTMCSSSLTAIHLACRDIQLGDCEAAIAGGVNLSLHPNKYRALDHGNFLSSKGLCESFGSGGDGYVPGEGVGVVLLKPLQKAIEDNDHIYGIIKGTAVNHGGKTNGYTVPNPNAQGNVIEKAFAMAKFHPRTISYLEAHGTGTALGDPIEITGLNKAFGVNDTGFCAIGSVKSNIGHCESAAGIAALTKVLLQMKYGQLAPSLHSTVLNPHIDFGNSPFIVQQELAEWKRPVLELDGVTGEYPRRAGISSFGAGGSNAHILLEEYIPAGTQEGNNDRDGFSGKDEEVLVVLSARNETQLQQKAKALLNWIKEQPQLTPELLVNTGYTLQLGREPMKERWAVMVTSFEQLVTVLEKYTGGQAVNELQLGRVYEGAGGAAEAQAFNKQLAALISKNAYDDIMNAWVKGTPVDWEQLYVTRKRRRPQRITLPAYPFAQDRYWFNDTAGHGSAKPVSEPVPVTNENKITAVTTGAAMHNGHTQPVISRPPDHWQVQEKMIYKLKVLFAGVVQFNTELIDAKDPLENYGIDSVMIVKLNSQLEALFGELPATLFYEYQTLEALADYFIRDHYNKAIEYTGLEVKTVVDIPAPAIHLVGNSKTSANRKTGTAGEINMHDREPIAIIGISGRFPGANDLNEYWENLKAGKDAITEIPEGRWPLNDFYHADTERAASLGKSYGKWGGFINGFADFDPLFFNMSPKEARGTDPQIRLFIESCWQVLEDAGYTRQQLAELYNNNVGVFAGITRAGFAFYAPQLMQEGNYYLNTMSAVANRVSYILNLKGPSVPVDTMCSSSLTAIHEACESILSGRCEMAIAGGVNLLLHPAEYVILSANNFLSTDGRCRSFGAGGNGYVPGEGVGTVLLKRLSNAIADKDHIYAVVKGTSINHGGKTNGYTVPNPVAQGELIRNALDKARIDARHISYVEAHGTGTSLGDPIEIAGLNQAFRADTNDVQYCSIGSSKSNIGHLEAAAGIAGVAKIILQMKHRTLVPSLHAKELNPNIRFAASPFYVQQSLTEWKQPELEVDGKRQVLPRMAGISSFGAGGANAHVILEEYIQDNRAGQKRGNTLVVLSAKNEHRLKAYAGVLLQAIQKERYTDQQLSDIAYTLQVGREAMDERLGIEAADINDLLTKLKLFIGDQPAIEGVYRGNAKAHKETIALLEDDAVMAATIRTWIAHQKYSKLLALWVKGLSINWQELYVNDQADVMPRRISLPGYPFDRKQYWIETPNNFIGNITAPASNGSIAAAKSATQSVTPINGAGLLQLMTFKESWQEKTPEAPVKERALTVKNIVWFVNAASQQKAIATAIGHWGNDVNAIFITRTKSDGKKHNNQYYIDNKGSVEQYSSVFNEIVAKYGSIDAMVYWWAIEDAAFVEDYNTLVAILQSVCKANIRPGHLVLAAQWQQQSEQAGMQRCYLDSWLGFERTFKLILPGVAVKALFKETTTDVTDISNWVDIIHTELLTYEPGSVLYKENKRFVYKITPTTITTGASRLKRNGTYLITGGLGKLGWLFARHLAGQYAANIILTGRSPVDLEKLDAMHQLENHGGQVFYLQADIGDREAMSKGLYQAKERFGTINGIIHAAGVIGAEAFADKTLAGFQKVLAPKVTGTLLLDDLLQDEPLDFICYFTSASAIIGDFGACDYSIANRFQMAFARYRNELMQEGKRKGVTYAINWPLWRDGGMDLDEEENTRMYLKSSGQRYLETAEGIDLFEQLITQVETQHLVFAGEEKRIHRFLGLVAAGPEKAVPPIKTAPAALTITAPEKALTLAEYVGAALTGLVSRAQQIPKDDIGNEENLADMGFDSISLSALALSINQQFDIEIAPSIFFSNPTIEKLKEYFLQEHRTIMEALYNSQQQDIVASA